MREFSITLPDFLGIGCQKCGTTWLHANLQAHPEAFVPEPKELHFFDRDWESGIASYAAKFAGGTGKIKGEITPAYGVLSRERIAQVREYLPEAKLLVMLRDPVRRAWSQAVMNLVTQKKRRYEDVAEKEFMDHFRGPASLARGDYAAILGNWIDAFGRDRIWIGMYDDLPTRPADLLTEVFRHVGLNAAIDWSRLPYRERIFEGTAVPLPDTYREALGAIYRPRVAELRERIGIDVARWKL